MDSGSSALNGQSGDAAAAAEAAKRAEVERLTDRLAQRFIDVPQMSVQQLKAAMEAPSPSDTVVLVDARLQEERAVSTLPGAISEAEWEARKSQYSKDKTLLVSYCTIGRSCGKSAI